MLDNNHIEAHGPAQPLGANNSPQPKKGEGHLRISRSFRKKWQPVLKPSEWSVYCAMLDLLGKNDKVWPSHALLAVETGLSISTVRRSLKALKSHALISWSECYEPTLKGRARQTSNRYSFGKNEQPAPAKVNTTPYSERTTKHSEREEVKKKDIVVADFKKSSSDVEESERPLTEKETLLLRQLIDLGVENKEARRHVTSRAEVVERQLKFFPFHAKSRTTEAAHIIHNIQHDWPDPRLKNKTPAAASPIPAEIEKIPAKKTAKLPAKPITAATSGPTLRTNQDNDSRVNESESETTSDVRIEAQKAHALFQSLPEAEQTELMELAKKEVSPIWHDRVGQPESPMSLGLWQIVAKKYPERF